MGGLVQDQRPTRLHSAPGTAISVLTHLQPELRARSPSPPYPTAKRADGEEQRVSSLQSGFRDRCREAQQVGMEAV